MTYDQWKTTDPRDYCGADPADEEDERTELDLVYEQLDKAREDAKYAAETSAARIRELTAALEEALEYFEDRYDVNDGSYGEPAPNKEMQIGQMIDKTLYGIRF